MALGDRKRVAEAFPPGWPCQGHFQDQPGLPRGPVGGAQGQVGVFDEKALGGTGLLVQGRRDGRATDMVAEPPQNKVGSDLSRIHGRFCNAHLITI